MGLKYGSDAMSAANLQNYSAFGGYALGYFDADGSFEELGTLPQLYEKITVTTDTTYHVQLSGTFYDYGDASRTAAQYSGGFAAYEDGAFYARAGSYTSLSAARSAAAQYGGTVVGGSSTGVTERIRSSLNSTAVGAKTSVSCRSRRVKRRSRGSAATATTAALNTSA